MKKILLCLVTLLFATQVFAQYEYAGMPLKYTPEKQSLKRSASNFFINLNADTTKVSLDASKREYVSGVTCPLNISMNDGNTFVEGDMKVWRVGLHSDNAKGISLYFDNFLLPEGGKLFVYNPSQTIVYGAFTSENNNDANQLLIRPLASDSIIVEYQEPFTAPFEAELHLSIATHELRTVNAFMASNECTQVVAYYAQAETVKRAVCLLYMVGDTQSYWGSGALINNANHKPYVYTAGHNIKTADLAPRTVYYFNYEVPDVDVNFQGPRQFTISGSKLISRDSEVDFALVELNKMPPADYRPYLAGWTRNTPKAPFMCVQHPVGDVKKASFVNELSVSYFNNYYYKTYWWVKRWAEGVTEKGSSGSPLFDADGYIVGNLTGGASECDSPVNDYFCQFTASWDYYSDRTKQLACYIDPNGTDAVSMEGYDPYLELGVKRMSNVKVGDKIANLTVDDKGTPLVGHTRDGITKFAEKFELTSPATVYGVYVTPFMAKYNPNNPITIEIYSGKDTPDELLSSAIVHPTEAGFYRNGATKIDDITYFDMQEVYVSLPKPVVVKENLFVVLKLSYTNLTNDDVLAMPSVMREGKGTALFYYQNDWYPFSEYISVNLSIWMDPVVGKADVTNINETSETQLNYAVYPNPTQGEVFVSPTFEGEYKLFDMAGKMIGTGVYDAQINLPEKGFYIMELLPNAGESETHKIICH